MRRLLVSFWLLASIALAGRAWAAPPLYRITDLGDLPGGNSISVAYALNDLGDVVGSGFSSPSFGPEAVLWSGGTITNLGDLAGGSTISEAFAINDAGRIVGVGASATTSQRATEWNFNGSWIANDLGDLPGGSPQSIAVDLNELGRAVGRSGASPTSLASRFEGGSVDALGIPVGTSLFPAGAQANAVNDLGQMAGQAAIGSGGATRALLWAADGSVQDIGALYPALRDSAQANDLNNLGVIVGWTGITLSTRAARWVGPVITDLGDLPGGTDSSEAHAINDAGTIVGESSATEGTHAFLWQDGVLYDLNDLIDPSDPLAATTELAQAFDINSSGKIVGRATIDGLSHAFLLTPVVQVPTSDAPIVGFFGLLLALTAVALLGLARRRHGASGA